MVYLGAEEPVDASINDIVCKDGSVETYGVDISRGVARSTATDRRIGSIIASVCTNIIPKLND